MDRATPPAPPSAPNRGALPGGEAHARSHAETLEAFGVSLSAGLSGAEIKRRRRLFGANRLRAVREKSPWRILLAQVNSLIVYLLAAAAVLSLAFGEWAEGGAIVAVLAINAAIGFSMELRAVRSMEALRRLAKVQTRVRRNGKAQTIGAEDIVPGDIVLLESGDVVPADIRLAEHTNLRCDESTFTGESVPVAKCLEAVRREAPVPERCNMAFKGTAVTRGAGAGVVVATGMATELGRIADLAERAEAELSPLERRLDRLGGQLVWATLALTALIAVIGVYSGQELIAMIKTAVALAVAAVPEGLPIVTTIALARGMWRMAQRNALIKHLAAIETLGATTVILTDKTGTLTENRMTVARLGLADHDVRFSLDGRAAFSVGGNRMTPQADAALDAALRVGVLCNDASLGDELAAGQGTRATGDPMELALLVAGRAAKLDRALLLRQAPKLREEAFSPETRMMATFHQGKTAYLVAVKGAPEAALQRCTQVLTAGGLRPLDADGRQAWSRRNDAMTADGLRILALAMKETDDLEESPYSALTLLGLVGLHDPPRADVAQAIAACREAGVRVVMLTGDQAGTAQAIAAEIGLAGDATVAIDASELKRLDGIPREQRKRFLEVTIFARVSPETKLDLVSLHQDVGAVVAMTGDGVNDAPALKKADIGIAMGQRGTEVAREVADMVLRDDAFPSIVVAMRYGRVILTNIRKCVVYLMSCNLSEIMVIGVATLSGLPLPLLPLQILYLNLVTDIFPAFALGVGEGDPNVMRRPPSDPKDPILGVERWVMLAVYAALLTAATLGAFWLALTMLDVSTEAAVTISFLTLAAGQIWHVFNLREADAGLFRNEVTGNPFVWIALGICVALIGAAIFVPALSRLLGMTPPDAASWALVLGASLAPVLFGQIAKAILARCGHQPGLKRLMSADRQGQAPERRG